MKKIKVSIILIFPLFVFTCKDDQKNLETNYFLTLIKNDKNHQAISLKEKKEIFEELLQSLYKGEGGDLDPTVFNNMPFTTPNSTEYVYFYQEDILKVLATIPNNCTNKGIKMYLKRHLDNMTTSSQAIHRYRSRPTVVLRSICNGIDITSTSDALYDYGDVCPPNCRIDCSFTARSTQQFKDGVCCENTFSPPQNCNQN